MLRAILAAIFLCLTSASHAGSLVTLHTKSGRTFSVAAHAAGAFKSFVDEFERSGFPIRFIGGWRAHGSIPHSLHPAGLAIDICQTGRNRVACQMPPNVTAMAERCGLVHGAIWRRPDAGHFELAGSHRYASRHRGRHHRRYARA